MSSVPPEILAQCLPHSLGKGLGEPHRIAEASTVLTLELLIALEIEHRRRPFQLTAGERSVSIGDGLTSDPVALVTELIRLAKFAAAVREEAVRLPGRGVADVVNEVSERLRRA